MSERTNTVIASVGTLGVAVLAAMWMATIGAWGPAVYAIVLALVIVWLLVSAERHRGRERSRGESPHHGNEVYWF
jgi:hypothetical protein